MHRHSTNTASFITVLMAVLIFSLSGKHGCAAQGNTSLGTGALQNNTTGSHTALSSRCALSNIRASIIPPAALMRCLATPGSNNTRGRPALLATPATIIRQRRPSASERTGLRWPPAALFLATPQAQQHCERRPCAVWQHPQATIPPAASSASGAIELLQHRSGVSLQSNTEGHSTASGVMRSSQHPGPLNTASGVHALFSNTLNANTARR